jgi:hypothetical protein
MQSLGDAYLSKYDESPGKEPRRRSMVLILSDELVALSRLRSALRLPATSPLWKLWNTVAGI